jgi:para-nitrobenzyl esterase
MVIMKYLKRAVNYFIVAAAIAALSSPIANAAEPLRVEGGQIAVANPDASGIKVFKGIPYASPPVGELRLGGSAGPSASSRIQPAIAPLLSIT